VVKRENIREFFETKLSQLGLNGIEAKEFMDYWMPRMKAHPYYLITFLKEEDINEMAPLHIIPPPTTLIRVMMDHTALDAPLQVPPNDLPPAKERKGFTAVEWGGLQR
jgi:hypothetical protein